MSRRSPISSSRLWPRRLAAATDRRLGHVRSTVLLAGIAIGLTTSAGYGATDRRVQGIVTSVEGQKVSIASHGGSHGNVSGTIDPAKTRILVDGNLARPADIQVTFEARAELGLDDVWRSIAC